MRGELFPEFSEELTEYIETHVVTENPHLSQDYEQIKQHYSIVLEYVQELENKITHYKNTIRKLKIADKDEHQDNVVLDETHNADIKSLKATIAGLKSTIKRKDNKIMKLEELIASK